MILADAADERDHSPAAVLGMGFIGYNLCQALSTAGIPVRALARSARPEIEGVHQEIGDAADPEVLDRVLSGCGTVYHLVGATVPEVGGLRREIGETLAVGGSILDACARNRVKRLIFASSGGTVYGVTPARPVREDAPTEPISAYGAAKLAMEKMVAVCSREVGFEHAVIRLSNPFGPHQSSRIQGVICRFLSAAMVGQPLEVWGDGGVVRDYLFVDDAVRGLMLAGEIGASQGVFNLGSGEGRSIRQIVDVIGAILGRPLEVRWLKGRPSDVPWNVLDITRARAILGWHPSVSFETAVGSAADWLAAQGKELL